jgi:signal transduction histidine kinase
MSSAPSGPAPSGVLRHVGERKRITAVIVVLAVAVVIAVAITTWAFYRQSLASSEAWLQSVVRLQASLIGELAEAEGGGTASLLRAMAVSAGKADFGGSGEFVLGRRDGETIAFLLPQRFVPGGGVPEPVPLASRRAEPMRLALAGGAGTVVARDYRDAEVLAAYTDLAPLGLGLVAKIDLEELRRPFLRIGLVVLGGTLLVVLAAVALTRRLMTPVLAAMAARAHQYEALSMDLGRSNRDLETFAYVASHDLRAPLRGIENLVDWLAEDLEGRLEEQDRRYMALLKGRTARMEALLDGLLEYSRIGRKDRLPEPVDTGALVADVIDLLAAPPGVTITVHGRLPVMQTPRVPLELVIRNLIGNAIKHNDRPDGRIDISVEDRGDSYEFTVADDGPGIPPAFHQRVFDLFQTLKPRDEVEGSGMGLALVQRTVAFYGGTIHLESDPEQRRGATFRFTWPKQSAASFPQDETAAP